MKKLLALLLLLLPAIALAAGGGGLPSRPSFQAVTVETNDATGATSALLGKNSTGAAVSVGVYGISNIAGANAPAAYRMGQCNFGIAVGTACRRWGLRKNFDAETGANAGSNFELETFDDTGAHLDYIFTCTRASGNCSFAHSLGSSKPCANGYSRVVPNFCAVNAASAQNVFSYTTTCTQTTALTGVTDAKGVLAQVYMSPTSLNSVGLREVDLYHYAPTDAACATPIFANIFSVQEFVATVANTTIGLNREGPITVQTNATGQWYAKGATTGGAGPGTTVVVLGYFD